MVAKVDIETVGREATVGQPHADPKFCCDANCAEASKLEAIAISAKAATFVMFFFMIN
jgi:hypothetical protein